MLRVMDPTRHYQDSSLEGTCAYVVVVEVDSEVLVDNSDLDIHRRTADRTKEDIVHLAVGDDTVLRNIFDCQWEKHAWLDFRERRADTNGVHVRPFSHLPNVSLERDSFCETTTFPFLPKHVVCWHASEFAPWLRRFCYLADCRHHLDYCRWCCYCCSYRR